MDQRLKNKSVHDWLGKRVVDQDWAYHEKEGKTELFIWESDMVMHAANNKKHQGKE